MTAWADAVTKGVAVLDPASWTDDGDAYTVQGVSRPVPTSAPVLGALVPSTLATDAPAQDVLVQGSGFVRGDRVVFGGATPPTSFHSDTELAVRADPSAWQAGVIQVSVHGSRGPSDAVDFTWTAGAVGDTQPAGTVAEVLAWVGDDPERAAQALQAERDGQQRSTLIARLEELTS
jgi:hypothetical protein